MEPEPVAVREQYSVFPQVDEIGHYVAAIAGETDVRPEYVKKLPDGAWRPFLCDARGYCFGLVNGDRYIAISTDGHPRGRLVSIPISTRNNRSEWTELLPESDLVLRNV